VVLSSLITLTFPNGEKKTLSSQNDNSLASSLKAHCDRRGMHGLGICLFLFILLQEGLKNKIIYLFILSFHFFLFFFPISVDFADINMSEHDVIDENKCVLSLDLKISDLSSKKLLIGI
jgi:hypothetical protein